MEGVCGGRDAGCAVEVLAGILHALQAYCCAGALLYVRCCHPRRKKAGGDSGGDAVPTMRWRGHVVRALASLGALAACGAALAAACLRPRRVAALSAACALAAWPLATAAHVQLERRACPAPLLGLAAYWALSAAAGAARAVTLLRAGAGPQHVLLPLHAAAAVLAALVAAVDLLVFCSHLPARRPQRPHRPPAATHEAYRHHTAHLYSAATFSWLRPLLRLGCARPLRPPDLGEPPACERAARHCDRLARLRRLRFFKDQETDTIQSLWSCYLRLIWPNFYVGGALKCLGDLVALVPPVGLAVVVEYAAAATTTTTTLQGPVTVREFLSNGYIMATIILVSSVAQGILSQNSTHLVYVEGIRLKTALQGLIFDKCMSIAPWSTPSADPEQDGLAGTGVDGDAEEEDGHHRAGVVTNLVTQDAYNVMSLVWVGHYIWAIPLKVIIILYLLYAQLGMSAIIGSMTAILLITPLQFVAGKKMSDNSKEIAKQSDHRISKIGEILQAMKTIKLCVWEDLFKEKMMNLREVELRLLNKESFYWGALTFLTHVSTVVTTAVTVGAHVWLEARAPSAVRVFAGLALVHQLTVPLLVLPVTVYLVVQAVVSTKRIEDFLRLPDVRPLGMFDQSTPTDEDKQDTSDVTHRTFSNGTRVRLHSNQEETSKSGHSDAAEVLLRCRDSIFAWSDDGGNPFQLDVEELDIPAGKLIMVVGPTGSGKTALLSALLGEMYQVKGELLKNESCRTTYSGQTPWMLNAHLRENITLGAADGWDAARYSRVLRAVGLQPDLQLLPDGDLTRLGALGVSLSPGQRARVCVARALYSAASLVVLDEPLGALDPALARHVVARGLLGAARAGRTVLLATNRLDLIQYADRVIVMEGGRPRMYDSVSDVLASEPVLRAGAAAAGAGAGGEGRAGEDGVTARERWRLLSALNRASLRGHQADDEPHRLVRRHSGVHGSLYLAELPAAAEWGAADSGGDHWARRTQPRPRRARPLLRQVSSPPAPAAPLSIFKHPSTSGARASHTVRRAVSADTSSSPALRREASALRRLIRRTTLRWTPRQIRKLLSIESASNGDLPDNDSEDKQHEEVEVETGLIQAESDNTESEEPLEAAVSCNAGVQARVYWEYVKACGLWAPAYGVAAVSCQVLAVAADCWLAAGAAQPQAQVGAWVRGYVYASAASAGAAGAAQALAQAGGAAARRRLHERLLHVVLHLPLRFFDTTPLGRTLNRFSADVLVLDKKVCVSMQRWWQVLLLLLSAVLVNAAVTPWSLLLAVPLAALYCLVQELYARNARELQRLDAASAAPVVSLLVEGRAGAAVVRAGGLQAAMRGRLLRRLDHNHNAFLLLNSANRWLGVALDVLGAVVVFVSLVTALACSRAAPGAVPPALVGLVAAYTMLLPAYLAWLGKFRAELDTYMGAVERILHYTGLPTEDYREEASAHLPAEWPARGEIVLAGASVRHGEDCAPVLRDVNLSIKPGSKVTICGRSGGGKSSLVLAIAGAAEICEGSLLVDGVDVRQIPLRVLRRRVVVLPQDAALFAGTLRENLDPLAVHTDEELWRCLRAVRLDEFVAAQSAGIECPVRADGAGWSAGQRARAVCARAVLCAAHASALVLDEPGAALDARADRQLLAAVAAAAPARTTLTVAHRVPSPPECERVVVVEGGSAIQGGAAPHPPPPPPPPPSAPPQST